MRNSVIALSLVFIFALIMTACSVAPDETVSHSSDTFESAVLSEVSYASSESSTVSEVVSAAISDEISAEVSAEAPGNNKSYTCRINENGSEDFVFEYADGVLVKIIYRSCIKGMPEEIEAAEAIKNYEGVIMSPSQNPEDSLIIFEIDVIAGGMDYLKDSNRLFENIDDHSWNSIKSVMEANGYTCSE